MDGFLCIISNPFAVFPDICLQLLLVDAYFVARKMIYGHMMPINLAINLDENPFELIYYFVLLL